ncbi:BON domain-containing protein [Legionella oakridgensis]|uniref:BON domain-containing protein n=1 Tax=Legionella oakridgensis TaxID=29423 RepID=UPI0003DE05D9|nr:BON domain-containing protein [Legionella oakridgensis]ETO92466.1 putative periplasmic or secreted lipoprotein [Legionella oakridgensis RV-2-2007]
MRNFCRNMMIVFGFAFLVACQAYQGENILHLQSNDNSLTAAVNEALRNNQELAPFRFHVETVSGMVYLSGYVKTIRQSDTAEALAKKVPGVKSVENNIIVRK